MSKSEDEKAHRRDFLYDPDFRIQIQAQVQRPSGGSAVRVDPRVADFLMERLIEHREKNARSDRRGTEDDALRSVAKLVVTAKRMANRRGNYVVSLGDVVRAYNRNFCTIWPFC